MLIKGTAEMGNPFEKLKEYFSYYLISDRIKVDKIDPEFMPENYLDFVKGELGKSVANKEYGDGIEEIIMNLICKKNANNLKVKKHFYETEAGVNTLSIDCILNEANAIVLSEQEQRMYLLQELKKTFTSINSYSRRIGDFNFNAFETDIQHFLDKEIIKNAVSKI